MKKIIKIIIFSFLLFIVTTPVYASTKTYERTTEDLGVNKNWTITSENLDNVYATKRVNAKEHIYDYADTLTDEEENELYSQIIDFIKDTNMDVAIVTIDEMYSDSQIEEFATDFYDYNDFGMDYDLYDGILIVRNVNNYNLYFNIYSFGNAQLYFPYNTCEHILDVIYPSLSNFRHYDGFYQFIYQSRLIYERGISTSMKGYYVDDTGHLQKKYTFPIIAAIVVPSIVTAIVMAVMCSKNKLVRKATVAGEYLNKESINYTKDFEDFVNSHTTSYTVQSSSSSGGGGGGGHFGSGSGSSGGGFSSGGGRHG